MAETDSSDIASAILLMLSKSEPSSFAAANLDFGDRTFGSGKTYPTIYLEDFLTKGEFLADASVLVILWPAILLESFL